MPVGTGFENSAMKASFSLSSLQASAETPDKGVKIRTCNSLNKKKRREEYWRRSWGSTGGGSTVSDQKDDFWSALQANYDYIMDNQLIDNCQEANGELTLDQRMWSLKEFYMQFSELYSWLNSIQETFCGRESNNPDESLRSRYISEIIQKKPILKLFNEQASQLVQLHPEMEEEVTWRVMRLNSKWESIEVSLGVFDCRNCNLHTCTDIQHELKRLRTWMKNTEAQLQPLVFRVKWTPTEIESKILEHKLLHRDIESHGKFVSSVVKLSKLQNDGVEGANVRRIARGLEKRWHLLFLRSLEWQCHIDSLSKNINGKNQTSQTESSESENDDEPLNKYPRLADSSYSFEDNTSVSEDNVNNKAEHNHSNNNTVMMIKPTDENCIKLNEKNETNLTPERMKFLEDSSTFTKSNRKAPNLGTYYFRHEDTTDSEIQTSKTNSSNSSKTKQQTTMEESSEDEWTYSSNDKNQISASSLSSNPPINIKTSCQDIQRLVQEAEELVRESPVKKIKSSTGAPLNKMSRVKQWLNMEKPIDSCDASCEEEDKDSQSSEDLNESVATCRAMQDLSSSVVGTDTDKAESSPKVFLRQKRTDLKRNRPWSISCISQLPYAPLRGSKSENFSISESALHQLSLSPKYSKSLATSVNSVSVYQNSTSSTMEEGGTTLVEHNSTPVRRRRLKFRKKSNSRRRSSNDPLSPIENSRERSGTLIKSGSFSGSSYKIINIERHTASDPSTAYHNGQQSLSTLSNTSDAESNEDGHSKGVPMFKIGEATTYLSQDIRDTSPSKSSLHNAEEQSSSLSEQAWDSYQEKYLSEAYSEAQDSDAARRLLEFGEDYRNFLDSQSDWSAQSTNPEFSPPFKRKILTTFPVVESESDSEDIRHLLKASREELLQTAKIFNQIFSGNLTEHTTKTESDIIATCDRHLYCLSLIEKSPEEYLLSKLDKEKTADLLQQWKRLKDKSNKMQEYRSLQKEILLLKNALEDYTETAPFETIINSMDDIRKSIEFYTTRLVNLEERKAKLLTLNVAVHRFVIENKNYNSTTLKNDISELYRIWYDIHNSASERLIQLKCLLQTWQTLECRLDQLHGDLQEDKETLTILDSALRDGVLSNHIATSVREVAKVLSETNQGSNLPGLLSESSYSDSGISDEGSEHEQGERERRLASIRHLMRQLETIMAPDCFARVDMSERFSAAEDELRSLQKQCRSLVVRTAISAVAPSCDPAPVVASDPGDPEDKSGGLSWFKRVVRASLPFQLAIVTLLCVACLLEPHCCDNMNTFSMSLSPQLRYIRGPPPV